MPKVNVLTCDLFIVGMGASGLAVANFASLAGMNVIIIDRNGEDSLSLKFSDVVTTETDLKELEVYGFAKGLGGMTTLWSGNVSAFTGHTSEIKGNLSAELNFLNPGQERLNLELLAAAASDISKAEKIVPYLSVRIKNIWESQRGNLLKREKIRLMAGFTVVDVDFLPRKKDIKSITISNAKTKFQIVAKNYLLAGGLIENTYLLANFLNKSHPDASLKNFLYPIGDHLNYKTVYGMFPDQSSYVDIANVTYSAHKVWYKIFGSVHQSGLQYCSLVSDLTSPHLSFPIPKNAIIIQAEQVKRKLSNIVSQKYGPLLKYEIKTARANLASFSVDFTNEKNGLGFNKISINRLAIKMLLTNQERNQLLADGRRLTGGLLKTKSDLFLKSASHFMGTTPQISESSDPHIDDNLRVRPFSNLYSLGNNCFLHRKPINPTFYLIFRAKQLVSYIKNANTPQI